jgi:hypothetical protein
MCKLAKTATPPAHSSKSLSPRLPSPQLRCPSTTAAATLAMNHDRRCTRRTEGHLCSTHTVYSPRQPITHLRNQHTDWYCSVSSSSVALYRWLMTASARARSVCRTSGLVARWDPIITYWCAANYAIGVCGLASFIKTGGQRNTACLMGRERDENQLVVLKYDLQVDKKNV